MEHLVLILDLKRQEMHKCGQNHDYDHDDDDETSGGFFCIYVQKMKNEKNIKKKNKKIEE